MGISKVIKKHTGEVLVDLTNDTVTAETLAAGRTAHNKYGDIITGNMTAGGIASLPALNNEGTADDLVQGKELIDSDGQIIVGTNPYSKEETDEEINAQSVLIDQIMSSLEGKASGGSGGASIKTCTIKIINEIASSGSMIDDLAYTYLNSATNNIDVCLNEMANDTRQEIILENILCGSFIYMFYHGGGIMPRAFGENGVIRLGTNDRYFKIPYEANTTGIIRIIDDD